MRTTEEVRDSSVLDDVKEAAGVGRSVEVKRIMITHLSSPGRHEPTEAIVEFPSGAVEFVETKPNSFSVTDCPNRIGAERIQAAATLANQVFDNKDLPLEIKL